MNRHYPRRSQYGDTMSNDADTVYPFSPQCQIPHREVNFISEQKPKVHEKAAIPKVGDMGISEGNGKLNQE